ncbi:MAG: hypothetical protein AMJ90_04560 [candidate division Zixibacteria bacterium SM23_73_2]|nr:MAG: hypothetical protein AMJ90_04560 [candidate division Zixibacteria bacterium SM23_73_2]
MVASMTGFGKSEVLKEGVKATVEISSVNNRFCDIQFRLPKFLSELEGEIKKLILFKITRGKINFVLGWEEEIAPSSLVKLNSEVADVYYSVFKELKEKYDLEGDLELKDFVNLPDILKVEKEEYDLKKAWEITREATLSALKQMDEMRRAEGGKLAEDLKERVGKLENAIAEIEKLSQKNFQFYHQKLKKRISEILDDFELDQQRVAVEAGILAERADVTEECVRLRSHNHQFLSALSENEAVGKRLTFLLQEMNREANTIGSKAIHPEIVQKVIFLKEEVEKLREQVQNIE